MKRIRQGWNTLRRSRRSGVSLIVALCAVAVLIGLSLSIVYSSSLLLSRANRKIGRERCYQLAQSFAQVLDSELQEYKTIKPELDTNFAPEGCFYREVNNILAEDTGFTIRTVRMKPLPAIMRVRPRITMAGLRFCSVMLPMCRIRSQAIPLHTMLGTKAPKRQSRQPLTDIRFG